MRRSVCGQELGPEGLTGLPFPRQDGVCTEFATKIILQHSIGEQGITTTILPSSSRPESFKVMLRSYRQQLQDFDELPVAIAEAGSLMGIRLSFDCPNSHDDLLSIPSPPNCGSTYIVCHMQQKPKRFVTHPTFLRTGLAAGLKLAPILLLCILPRLFAPLATPSSPATYFTTSGYINLYLLIPIDMAYGQAKSNIKTNGRQRPV